MKVTSPFETLSGPGKPLKAEPPDAKEFAGLTRSAQARLQDALNRSLSLESRFDLAYNAAAASTGASASRTRLGFPSKPVIAVTIEQWIGPTS